MFEIPSPPYDPGNPSDNFQFEDSLLELVKNIESWLTTIGSLNENFINEDLLELHDLTVMKLRGKYEYALEVFRSHVNNLTTVEVVEGFLIPLKNLINSQFDPATPYKIHEVDLLIQNVMPSSLNR